MKTDRIGTCGLRLKEPWMRIKVLWKKCFPHSEPYLRVVISTSEKKRFIPSRHKNDILIPHHRAVVEVGMVNETRHAPDNNNDLRLFPLDRLTILRNERQAH